MPAGKPPYRVPLMDEIRALPWNGYNVASTFSGCGGSSLGYRLAGFRVRYANEFVPAAQETYRANAAPYTYLDTRDIRVVTGADLLSKCGLAVGELDLLDGSPPCASFSTAGSRHAGWGKVKSYSDTSQRTDDLFYEYARLLMQTQPKTFVAENVSGLIKGSAKGYFIKIMQALKACGYQVSAQVLDAQWLGVPQSRQRLIIMGVRNDLGIKPIFPAPLPYRYSVREVLSHIVAQGDNGGFGTAGVRPSTQPSGTLGATPYTGNGRTPASLVIDDGTRYIHDTSGDRSTGDITDRPSPTVTVGVNLVNSNHYRVVGSKLTTHDPETGKDLRIAAAREYAKPGTIARKFTLGELRRIGGFPDDFVLTGTYEQRWERIGRAVPPVMMAAVANVVRSRILDRVKGVSRAA